MTTSIRFSPPSSGKQTPTVEPSNNNDTNKIPLPIERLQSIPSEDIETTPVTITNTVLPTPIEPVQSITTEEMQNPTLVNTTTTTTIQNKTTASLPIRYGVAAAIPYDDEFDLQTVLRAKSSIPFANHSNNDLLEFLQNEKSKKVVLGDSSISDLLKENSRERNKLVQVARKAQQDFLAAIQLD